jgi:hypothetical protein
MLMWTDDYLRALLRERERDLRTGVTRRTRPRRPRDRHHHPVRRVLPW